MTSGNVLQCHLRWFQGGALMAWTSFWACICYWMRVPRPEEDQWYWITTWSGPHPDSIVMLFLLPASICSFCHWVCFSLITVAEKHIVNWASGIVCVKEGMRKLWLRVTWWSYGPKAPHCYVSVVLQSSTTESKAGEGNCAVAASPCPSHSVLLRKECTIESNTCKSRQRGKALWLFVSPLSPCQAEIIWTQLQCEISVCCNCLNGGSSI